MRLTFLRESNSITEDVTAGDIADFVVLSGPNGSGKSNLLEAIRDGAIRVDDIPEPSGQPVPAIRFFGIAQLVATAEGAQNIGAFSDRWIQLEQVVRQSMHMLMRNRMPGPAYAAGSDELEEAVRNQLVAGRQLLLPAIERMVAGAGKRLTDFTTDDFRNYSPLFIGVRDPFTFTVGELFLAYHHRRNRNKYYQWLVEQGEADAATAMTDAEYESRYGPPPWDLLNETLSLVGLEYSFVPPVGREETLTYEAKLVHNDTSVQVTLAQLSSGEKTLAAIAMSLYTGSELGEAIELPKVLLLDEADASLHPSMVRSLLRVTDDIFCKRYGVKVLLTTHSPSTVALAPAEALYSMRRRGIPRLRSVSRDEALKGLTVGISTLSVRIENRRQVFVERSAGVRRK